MSTFLLLHGAWHGAWCWHKLIPLLEKAGHEVVAPDLPGLGNDKTPATNVSLETYTRFVTDLLDSIDSPVVLVGHSMSGAVISRVAELRPAQVNCLVYLAAYLLPNGQSILETTREDTGSLVLPNLVYSRDRKTARVRDTVIREAFYADCSEEDCEFAGSRLVQQALAPLSAPVKITGENWGRVPRYYIECTQDRIVSIGCQRRMQARLSCRDVMSLDTSHSPFLSAPEQLLESLLACND
ncbi:MAG TPA: alpha/beta fold hydrolase [Gammaproteobacteria bacterium]|nr:alpha/beta fold hydrolase [Gammaproteobacteria bacterium]